MKEILELRKQISELKQEISEKQATLAPLVERLSRLELQASRQRSKDSRRAAEVREAILVPFLQSCLEPGMVVKVSGSRNQGFRRIKSIGKISFSGLHLNWSRGGGWRDGSYITDHGIEKVTKILVDNVWIDAYAMAKRNIGTTS